MTLITHTELQLLVADGLLTVPTDNEHPYNKIEDSQINGASVDVRLGKTFLRETPPGSVTFRPSYYVCLKGKEKLVMSKEVLPWHYPFYLAPGEFILAQTVEIFNMPNNVAGEFRLKSSVARAGLDQALAVWLDPGWHNSVLTIELRNNTRFHTLVLEPGQKIGQVVFFKGEPIPDSASYATRGQYNNLSEVTGNLGVR